MIRTVIACLILFFVVVAGWAVDLVAYHEQTPTLAPLQTFDFARVSFAPHGADDLAERGEILLPR